MNSNEDPDSPDSLKSVQLVLRKALQTVDWELGESPPEWGAIPHNITFRLTIKPKPQEDEARFTTKDGVDRNYAENEAWLAGYYYCQKEFDLRQTPAAAKKRARKND